MGVCRFALTTIIMSLIATPSFSGEARSPSSAEWEKTVEAAKKEGKLVAALPASAELRKAIGEIFPKRFPGIELDLTNARGPSNASKIAAEHAAGVRYFDLLISGTATPFSLLNAGILEPVEPLLLLPEVKDPKRWFGGHVWLDNAKRFIYAFQVYQSENIWHNPTLMKVEDVRSYDDLLNPKWKGKIGILDPRSPGSRHRYLGLFLENQRRRIFEETRRARNVLIPRSAPVGRQFGQRQNRAHHRPQLLYFLAVPEGRAADQTPAGYERRHLHELRQQRSVRGQELTASRMRPKFSSTGSSARKAKRFTAKRWDKRRAASTSRPNGWSSTACARRKIF